jgi:hypothetical protein
MTTTPGTVDPGPGDRRWVLLGRRQEYEGEGRANLLRVAAVGAFYVIELANYHGLSLGGFQIPAIRGRPFHLAVTALAVAWTMVGLAVHLCLRRQVVPPALPFLTTGCDLALLTCVLAIADGPRSPLVVAYFLIIALAMIRFNLPLVRFATLGAMAGYLALLGHARWYAVRDLRVPRYHEAVVLLALALTGITLGQAVRRVRSLVRHPAGPIAPGGRGNVEESR